MDITEKSIEIVMRLYKEMDEHPEEVTSQVYVSALSAAVAVANTQAAERQAEALERLATAAEKIAAHLGNIVGAWDGEGYIRTREAGK